MTDTENGPFPLEVVLEKERLEILAARERRNMPPGAFSSGDARPPAVAPCVPIAGSASPANPAWQSRDKEWVDTVKAAHRANLVGLALSGGGVRSATFNLGVLQALAELKLLHRIDYLSTVSGGGYIGGWLAAWTKRLGSFGEVQKRLATNRVHQKDDKEPTPIRFLRVFSNYLTAKVGILSGDTWSMVAIYLRNTLLNAVVVLAMVGAALLTPRFAVRLGTWTQGTNGMGWVAVAGGLLLLALVISTSNMRYLDHRGQRAARELTKPRWILVLVGVPLFFDAVLGALWFIEGPLSMRNAAAAGAVGYGVIWMLASSMVWLYGRCHSPTNEGREGPKKIAEALGARDAGECGSHSSDPLLKPRKTSPKEYVITLLGAVGVGALAGWLYALLSAKGWSVNGALTVGVPLVMGILLVAGTLHIGLMGIVFSDRRREWWGRVAGWLLLWGLAWTVIFWVALCFPHFILHNTLMKQAWATIGKKYLTPAWVLTTVGGVLAGKSRASGKPGTQTWKDVLAKVGPYAFVAGLLCWVSYGIHALQSLTILSEYAQGTRSLVWGAIDTGSPRVNALSNSLSAKVGGLLACISTHRLLWAIAGCMAVAVLMAWRVDINQFSMHLFYRNRLVRCYLGASNETRSPNRFTGFDASDDIPLKDLTTTPNDGRPYDGPFPVLNSSLNLVKGKDLAWQERKAESFVMTPLYCGYDVWLEEQDSPMVAGTRDLAAERPPSREGNSESRNNATQIRNLAATPRGTTTAPQMNDAPPYSLEHYGYRPTARYAFPPPGKGFFLGTAMGISGAAASPNMGFYTSPPVAFLMTVFNVRLGQWSGNPRHRRTWTRSAPQMGLSYLLNELFGGTDDDAAYVYLSDGGHFENMALYELVKRRCGLIIVCDAEADAGYGFAGLSNAIRKCRIDMGIDIQLDVKDIAIKKAGAPSKNHCAVGTIHYEAVDLEAPTGTIIYLKASLTGDEPTDVRNYNRTYGAFPHESTIDQWFSEAQFESYRQLGYHEVISSIQGAPLAAANSKPMTPSPADLRPAAPSPPAAEPTCLSGRLREIFKEFGFDTSNLVANRE